MEDAIAAVASKLNAAFWFLAWTSWTLSGILGAMLGQQVGLMRRGAWLGLLLGPFGVLAISLTGDTRRQCEDCQTRMHDAATRCHACGREVSAGMLRMG